MKNSIGYKSVFKLGIIFFIIATIWTSIRLYQYYTGAELQLDNYIKYLKEKDYDKLYDLLQVNKKMQQYTKQDIINCYRKLYEIESDLIEVEKHGKVHYFSNQNNEQTGFAYGMIKYSYPNKEFIDKIYIIKVGDEWKVQCPFQTYDIRIYAPIGSDVYIGDEKVVNYEEDSYIKRNSLPGKYDITVQFPNQIYNDYKEIINVPEVKDVFLNYKAMSVEIKTAKGAIVELAGIRKKNIEGTVNFNNILEGNYEIKVYYLNDMIEPITKKVSINKTERLFDLSNITLSQSGKEELKNFMSDFYNHYIKSIKDHDIENIMPYIEEEHKEEFTKYFKDWFINNKNIQEAKIIVKPKKILFDESGILQTHIVEVIELKNKEYNEYQKREVLNTYKVLLEWETNISVTDEKWRVNDRKLIQSIVAYKDYEGKWIEY